MIQQAENIENTLRQQLIRDDRVRADDIKLQVENNGVVLSGTVPTYVARLAAYENARTVPGVVSVNNQIRVMPSISTDVPTDAEIQQNVSNLLLWSSVIDSSDIRIDVEKGHVTLSGTVNSYWKKLYAEDFTAYVMGVTGITNQLAVTPEDDIADDATAKEIVEALAQVEEIDAEAVNVRVKDGVVTLSGTVPHWSAYQRAHNIARYTFGVRDVYNEVVIG